MGFASAISGKIFHPETKRSSPRVGRARLGRLPHWRDARLIRNPGAAAIVFRRVPARPREKDKRFRPPQLFPWRRESRNGNGAHQSECTAAVEKAVARLVYDKTPGR